MGFVIMGIIATMTYTAIMMYVPYVTKIVIDDYLSKKTMDGVGIWMALLIIIPSVRGILWAVRSRTFNWISQGTMCDIRKALFDRLLLQSFSFFNKQKIGRLLNRFSSDLDAVRKMIMLGSKSIFESLFTIILTVIAVSAMDVRLLLCLVIYIPLFLLNGILLAKSILPAYKEIRSRSENISGKVTENISGIRVAKAFANEDVEMSKFRKTSQKYFKAMIRAMDITAKYEPGSELINGFVGVLVLLIGGYYAIIGEITVGDIVAFTAYLFNLKNPLSNMLRIINYWEESISSFEKIFTTLDAEIDIKTPVNAIKECSFTGNIEFKNVSFAYEQTYSLLDINLSLKKGRKLAIMGKTGSGKTTLIELLARLYDVSEGEILIDEKNIKEYDLHTLRRNFGFVMQDNFLFSDTIRNNIAFGKPDADIEEIKKAARIAQADEFIKDLKDGYDTVVGERGLGLSGGQKQRLAIARALLLDPPILIFDDSTSAVDMETEQAIQDALESVMKDRTTIIIAHRISSVKSADEIVYLENGRIAERGTHSQLMDLKGRYYKTFKRQFKGFQSQTASSEKKDTSSETISSMVAADGREAMLDG